MAWFAGKKDYAREHKETTGITTSPKTKLPTNMKSKKMFCRNCLRQIKAIGKPCAGCGVVAKPLSRRK